MADRNAPRKSNRIPSKEDRVFIRAVADGDTKTVAFKKAYPSHPSVARYMDIIKNKAPHEEGEPAKLRLTINRLARDKAQAKYITERIADFQDSMEVLAAKSIMVANELLDTASDKVRKDLAIEFIRQKVGTPVQKVQAQIDKTVTLEFGTPHQNDNLDDIIEGEVISEQEP